MPRDPFVIPPGGYAAFAQMTPASRAALNGGLPRSKIPRKRKKKASTKRASARPRARAKGKKKGKMKFGSPAWQKKYGIGKWRGGRKLPRSVSV